jgi:hypothetical protein
MVRSENVGSQLNGAQSVRRNVEEIESVFEVVQSGRNLFQIRIFDEIKTNLLPCMEKNSV